MYIMSPYSGKLIDDDEVARKYDDEGHWGLMVSIDLGECDHGKISSKEHITQFAIDLADFIDMRRYGEPMVVFFGDNAKVQGYSLMQFIETSQISGHFAEDTDRAFIDIFSCKRFKPREAAEFTRDYFGAGKMQYAIAFRDI